jgi:hypothetical protein
MLPERLQKSYPSLGKPQTKIFEVSSITGDSSFASLSILDFSPILKLSRDLFGWPVQVGQFSRESKTGDSGRYLSVTSAIPQPLIAWHSPVYRRLFSSEGQFEGKTEDIRR